MLVTRLWTATLTRQIFGGDPETDSSINISVNTAGVERLNNTFPDTQQSDQEAGIANLYDVDVANRNILTEQLTDSSIRLGINGDDAWRPRHVFIFGEAAGRAQSETVALAIETNITTELSTDDPGAQPSMPLHLVGHGDGNQTIQRLFIMLRSIDSNEPPVNGPVGVPTESLTEGPLQIQIVI